MGGGFWYAFVCADCELVEGRDAPVLREKVARVIFKRKPYLRRIFLGDFADGLDFIAIGDTGELDPHIENTESFLTPGSAQSARGEPR